MQYAMKKWLCDASRAENYVAQCSSSSFTLAKRITHILHASVKKQ